MKHFHKNIALVLCALCLVFSLISCSEKSYAIEGVWAIESEDLYFFFYPEDLSWKLIDANEGLAAKGTFTTDGKDVHMYVEDELYLELTFFNEYVLEYDGGMIGYMYPLTDPQATALLNIGE